MTELKPCPFCGRKPCERDLREAFDEEYNVESCFIMCRDCGTFGPEGFSFEDAIEAWNRRADNGRFDQQAGGD